MKNGGDASPKSNNVEISVIESPKKVTRRRKTSLSRKRIWSASYATNRIWYVIAQRER